jgi:arginine deiminase
MAFSVSSEVGVLRKVTVHRPGREHTRSTPSKAEELLFDNQHESTTATPFVGDASITLRS